MEDEAHVRNAVARVGKKDDEAIHDAILAQFQMLPESTKQKVLSDMLDHCSTATLGFVSEVIVPKVKRDFVGVLPQELGTRILSYLDFRTLGRISVVSRAWYKVVNDDFLWRELCKRSLIAEGQPHHQGQWKRLFMSEHLLRRNWSQGKCTVTTLTGHTRSVFAVRFEGARCVSASYDGTLKVWDMETGHCLRTLAGHTKGVTSVVLMGGVVTSSSSDLTIRLWDTNTGSQLRSFQGHVGEVCSISVERSTLVSGSCDRSIRTWDLETGEMRLQLVGHTDYVISVQIRHGLIVSGSFDNTVRLWNSETGECLGIFQGHTEGVKCVAMNDEVIVSGAQDCTAIVWDIQTGRLLHILRHSSAVWCVQLEEGTSRLLTTTGHPQVHLWDWKTGQEHTPFVSMQHTNAITSAQFDRYKIVTSSFDKTVKIWRFL